MFSLFYLASMAVSKSRCFSVHFLRYYYYYFFGCRPAATWRRCPSRRCRSPGRRARRVGSSSWRSSFRSTTSSPPSATNSARPRFRGETRHIYPPQLQSVVLRFTVVRAGLATCALVECQPVFLTVSRKELTNRIKWPLPSSF